MKKSKKRDELDLILNMEEILKKIPNKYEFVLVTTRYAHIIARRAMEEGEYLRRKPFIIAAEAVMDGKVKYTRRS